MSIKRLLYLFIFFAGGGGALGLYIYLWFYRLLNPDLVTGFTFGIWGWLYVCIHMRYKDPLEPISDDYRAPARGALYFSSAIATRLWVRPQISEPVVAFLAGVTLAGFLILSIYYFILIFVFRKNDTLQSQKV